MHSPSKGVRDVITERMCLDVVKTLHGSTSFLTKTLNVDDAARPTTTKSSIEHALPTGHVYRRLLAQYSLTDIETTVRWLEVGEYIGYTGVGLESRMAMQLTAKGIALAAAGQLEAAERDLVYQENPYAAFVARQFRTDDAPLFEYLRDFVLAPLGIQALDGRVYGIEAFRGEILRKIRAARFFICLLTHRDELREGGFASSVWLYQETGAAVALGKKPLILVEEGLHDHFAGELQRNYEYLSFKRSAFAETLLMAGQRLRHDLEGNHIPILS